MKAAPYTPNLMDAREETQLTSSHVDELHAEALAALSDASNMLRALRERSREALREERARWERLRDDLETLEGTARTPANGRAGEAAGASAHGSDAGESDGTGREQLRLEVERVSAEIGKRDNVLGQLELAQRTVENAWLYLDHGDEGPLAQDPAPGLAANLQLRIVEAQEGERARLAQEVHDGPAQALTNAIFQVEYIERVLDQDPRLAQSELRLLRQLLRRELGDVRTFISQLRPRTLDQLGLEGSIQETVENMAALTGTSIEANLAAPASRLNDAEQTVVLRIVQEALQNAHKHAAAHHVTVKSRLEDGSWILEVHDDGRGFDVPAVATRGRRNFGLQFMRERAELIGARFEVRSRPEAGTVVWLAIPLREERG